MAVGLRLADVAAVIPRGDDPKLPASVCDLAESSGADVLCCTVAEEMTTLHGALPELARVGLRTWLPTPIVLRRCIDKWEFAQLVRDAGIPAPATALGDGGDVPGPWVVKPRIRTQGSVDVYLVDDLEELRWALAGVEDPIVQTRLVGSEFTVDALVDTDGSTAAAVMRWRLETKAGISTKGRTFFDASVARLVDDVLGTVGLTGPACVQGFVDASGEPSLVEVNPEVLRWASAFARGRRRPRRPVPEGSSGREDRSGSSDVSVRRRHAAPPGGDLRRGAGVMRVVIPFGTRPEIIKLAPVIAALRSDDRFTVRAVATGQHYDRLLTDVMFEELELRPDAVWELPVAQHARLGAMTTLAAAELEAHRPDLIVLLETHTRSRCSVSPVGRRVSAIVHLEAGLRSFNETSLEEVHRKVAAATASLHLAPTELAADFLRREGVPPDRIRVVGNPVLDVLRAMGAASLPVSQRSGVLFTAHRASNVDDPKRLRDLVAVAVGLAAYIGPVLWPLHPRTRNGW